MTENIQDVSAWRRLTKRDGERRGGMVFASKKQPSYKKELLNYEVDSAYKGISAMNIYKLKEW